MQFTNVIKQVTEKYELARKDHGGHKNRAKPGYVAITTRTQFVQITGIILCHYPWLPRLKVEFSL